MNELNFNILSSCRISDQKALVNGRELLTCQNPSEWLNEIYRAISMAYPKFFKMDNLCKAGTLASEILLKDIDFDRENVKENWGIILMNQASSIDDDRKYQATISNPDNYFPSPAVFVYTLANIVTGEIAIRHKIGGESSFYILEKFSAELLAETVELAFLSQPQLSHTICGWADYDNGHCDVLFLLVQKSDVKYLKTNILEEISKLYNL